MAVQSNWTIRIAGKPNWRFPQFPNNPTISIFFAATALTTLLKILVRIWASPYSLLGICIGILGLISGGQFQLVRGVFEFHGGAVSWLLKKTPVNAVAMTLGHTIIGRNQECLRVARNHEHIHVRQYERWGPLFGPAYLLSSLYLWVVKRDPYLDNPFEVEAYAKEKINLNDQQQD